MDKVQFRSNIWGFFRVSLDNQAIEQHFTSVDGRSFWSTVIGPCDALRMLAIEAIHSYFYG